MRILHTVLLILSIGLTLIVLATVAPIVPALQQYHDDLSHLVQPASERQPYGGCDEAWQAPESEGAQWCRDNGFAVPLNP